jgi:hypothetical protein
MDKQPEANGMYIFLFVLKHHKYFLTEVLQYTVVTKWTQKFYLNVTITISVI